MVEIYHSGREYITRFMFTSESKRGLHSRSEWYLTSNTGRNPNPDNRLGKFSEWRCSKESVRTINHFLSGTFPEIKMQRGVSVDYQPFLSGKFSEKMQWGVSVDYQPFLSRKFSETNTQWGVSVDNQPVLPGTLSEIKMQWGVSVDYQPSLSGKFSEKMQWGVSAEYQPFFVGKFLGTKMQWGVGVDYQSFSRSWARF